MNSSKECMIHASSQATLRAPGGVCASQCSIECGTCWIAACIPNYLDGPNTLPDCSECTMQLSPSSILIPYRRFLNVLLCCWQQDKANLLLLGSCSEMEWAFWRIVMRCIVCACMHICVCMYIIPQPTHAHILLTSIRTCITHDTECMSKVTIVYQVNPAIFNRFSCLSVNACT